MSPACLAARICLPTLLIAVCLPARALVVTTAVDESLNPGTGLSLREAIDNEVDGGTITFDPSMSGETCSIIWTLGYLSAAGKKITIDASSLAEPFIVDFGGFGDTAFSVNDSLIGGGGVSDGALTLKNLRVVNCLDSCVQVADNAEFTAVDCAFVDNGSFSYTRFVGTTKIVFGGAIYCDMVTDVSLTRCVFENNRSTAGGAIYSVYAGLLTLKDCSFLNNLSDNSGGAIQQGADGSLRASRCTFADNRASIGGAIVQPFNAAQSNVVQHCTFSNNSATDGSAIYSGAVFFDMSHCTVVQNPVRAGFMAPAPNVAVRLTQTNSPRIQISHSILAYNLDDDGRPHNFIGPDTASTGYNLTDDEAFVVPAAGDVQNVHPLLGPLARNGGDLLTHMPYASSPAIDAGDPAFAAPPAVDQRGEPRVVAGHVAGPARIDIGACEAGPVVMVDSLDDALDAVPPTTLREALASAPAGGRIVFSPALNDGVIRLASSAGGLGLPLAVGHSVSIDATSLPEGLEISGMGETQVLTTGPNIQVSLHGLTLKAGVSADYGGGVLNQADLLLDMCTLHGNTAPLQGGGIRHSFGHLHLHNTTLSQNHAGNGGALSDNAAAPSTLQIEYSTFFQNSVANSGAGLHLTSSDATFRFSILAQNTNQAGTVDNVFRSGLASITSLNFNVEDTAEAGFTASNDVQNTSAGLTPLADHGGFAKTCLPGSGSPAVPRSGLMIDSTGIYPPPMSPFDGRGYSRTWAAIPFPPPSPQFPQFYFNAVDAGAHQTTGTNDVLDADGLPTYWEQWNGLNPYDPADALLDHDGDGVNTVTEYNNGTDPFVADGGPDLIGFGVDPGAGELSIRWQASPSTSYDILGGSTVDSATATLTTVVTGSSDTNYTHTEPGWNFSGISNAFFRIRKTP